MTAAAVTAPASAIIHPSDCTYTSCYCEENVYLLIKTLSQHRPSSQLFAVFISNTNETVSEHRQHMVACLGREI